MKVTVGVQIEDVAYGVAPPPSSMVALGFESTSVTEPSATGPPPVSWKLAHSKAKGNNYDLLLSVNVEVRILCQIMGIEVVMRYEKKITKKVAGDGYCRGREKVEDRGVREFKNGRGVIFLASEPHLNADFFYDLNEESDMIAKLEAEGWQKVEAK